MKPCAVGFFPTTDKAEISAAAQAQPSAICPAHSAAAVKNWRNWGGCAKLWLMQLTFH